MTSFSEPSTAVSSEALRSSLRKSTARALAYVIATVVLMCGAATFAALLFTVSEPRSLAIATAVTVVMGSAAGYLGSQILSSRISTLATRSIELLFERPELADDLPTERLHWTGASALTWGQAEEDVEALRRLIRRSARRSAALMSELEEEKKAADSHEQARAQFLSRASHELRTPLNAILGYATLLREDAIESGQSSAASDLERILVAGRNLLSIVNDMLGLTELDTGGLNIDRQVIDVRSLVDSLDVEEIGGKGRLEVQIDDGVRIIIGDASKLRQCLQTLVVAAAAKSTAGSIGIRVTQTDCSGNPHLCFKIGTADEDAAVTSEERGSKVSGEAGLGLAIARRLATLMHGECVIDDVSGRRFRLTIPMSPPRADEPAPPSCGAVEKDCSGHETRRKKALIVDDDEAALDLMRRWLAEIGYDVLVAHEGETGLGIARNERPDLIILDGILPGRSGYEILADLRSDPDVGRTPVIFVTVDDDRRRGIGCGASEYLRKPLTQGALRAILDVYADHCAGEILIIDDDDDAAELIRRGVEEVGFSTRRAHDGLEGLDMAAASPPSAIVLDIGMPELDGFGVIERLARADHLNRIPIVVVSGHDLELAEHRQLAAAAHRVFTKGITTPREIAQSLREVVA